MIEYVIWTKNLILQKKIIVSGMSPSSGRSHKNVRRTCLINAWSLKLMDLIEIDHVLQIIILQVFLYCFILFFKLYNYIIYFFNNNVLLSSCVLVWIICIHWRCVKLRLETFSVLNFFYYWMGALKHFI